MLSTRRRQDRNPLGKPAGSSDLFKMDQAIHGMIRQADEGMQTAYPINIAEIMPDPKQPRRLLPGALRYDQPVTDVLGAWYDLAREEARREIPIVPLLKGEDTARSGETYDYEPGMIESGLIKLVTLAAAIRRDGGLINPVTIYRSGTGYTLETGERRWLAHHLLAYALEEEFWLKISAREVSAPSIWRQAHENTARDDLNAISLARQLALLVMDIYREKGATFLEYGDFGHDRHYYAQVADGTLFPVAYGERERIIAAMGKTSVSQVNQYRALLRLPDDFWLAADEANWPEKKLRELLQTVRESEPPTPAPAPEPEAESITQVIDVSNVQAQSEDTPDDDEPKPEAAPGKLPPLVLNLLDWAYRWAARQSSEAGTWFSTGNAGVTPDRMNALVDQGLFDNKGSRTNSNYHAAIYRISATGCAAIEKEPLSYNFSGTPNHLPPGADQQGFTGGQRRPVSAGQAHAGSGKQEGSTPPRQKVHYLLQGTDRLYVETALRSTNERLDTADGLRDAITTFERSIAAQQRILDELKKRQAD